VAKKPENVKDIFMRRRTVLLVGEINKELVADIAERLLRLQDKSAESINLLIDSSGGELRAALQLCDFISHVLTVPVRGIAYGRCNSAATFVMLHCAERLSTPYAGFLIHSGTIDGISISVSNTTPVEIEQLLAESRATEEEVVSLYMRKLKKTRDEVQKLIAKGDQRFDHTKSAEQAIEIGLIERIVEGKLDIFPPAPDTQQ
jgi:ATP-dependent protease ClpP protease subunit